MRNYDKDLKGEFAVNKKLFTLIALIALGLFGSTAATPAQAGPAATNRILEVTAGNTLWAISQATGTGVAEWAALNGIKDPDLIIVGQTLLIPGKATLINLEKKGDLPVVLGPPAGTVGPPPMAAWPVYCLDP